MTDDMSTADRPEADPVDVAEDFATATSAETTQQRIIEAVAADYDKAVKLGQWLVAEAEWHRRWSLAEAERIRRVYSAKLDKMMAGATPDYVHDDRTAITRPGDFIAWFLQLDEAERLKTAGQVLKHAEEAGRCFFDDHVGRIFGLESQVRTLLDRGSRGGVAPEQRSALHPCHAVPTQPCTWDAATGLHDDGTRCLEATMRRNRAAEDVVRTEST